MLVFTSEFKSEARIVLSKILVVFTPDIPMWVVLIAPDCIRAEVIAEFDICAVVIFVIIFNVPTQIFQNMFVEFPKS